MRSNREEIQNDSETERGSAACRPTTALLKQNEKIAEKIVDNSGVTTAQQLFRQLRSSWFDRVLQSKPQEHQWEEPEEAEARAEDNAERRELYDRQTEALLNGHRQFPVTPYCLNDYYRFRHETP